MLQTPSTSTVPGNPEISLDNFEDTFIPYLPKEGEKSIDEISLENSLLPYLEEEIAQGIDKNKHIGIILRLHMSHHIIKHYKTKNMADILREIPKEINYFTEKYPGSQLSKQGGR